MKSPRLERTVAGPALIVALVCLLGGAAAFESARRVESLERRLDRSE